MLIPVEFDDFSQKIESIRSLMEAILKALVDCPEELVVTAVSSTSGTVIVVKAAAIDAGKIIGKQGRTARSLRTILSASSLKYEHSFSLDIQQGE